MPGARTGAGATRADAPSVTPGRRYSSIQLPRGFYHLCLGWLDVFPPPGPLASSTPAASWWLTLRRMLRPLRMMPILLSGPRYRWEVVVIFLLDVWAGLPGGVGSLVPAQGREGTLAAPVAGEAHDGNLPLLPPGLAQVSHSVKGAQPREAAGESRAASSTWRAKSTRWRSGWTNDCLGEESASSWSPPGESKVPACLDVAQRGRGWQQGPCEPFLSWPSPCGDGLEPAPTPGMQSRDSRRDAQGLL
ncbi:uncharacterized protein LOC143170591 isoform X2 [Aptenodytes patagonicus]|uniref:uncharacterized protein LOC143170591 isoform X2 n=1 Tax=Aptenodytes patagonicus TaxID=9234 RepID=UPI003F9FEB7C